MSEAQTTNTVDKAAVEQLKTQISEWITSDDTIALVATQYLEPAEGKDAPIFPPTYPMPAYRGRTHTVHDGEYRVSVELPPFGSPAGRKEDADKKDDDKAGYNIDHLRKGKNICEVDSPQSQANRMEPSFKTLCDGKLVPQIVIDVKGQKVNLLDAGHRAADAVVRFSSLCAEFHNAFEEAGKGNHGPMAKLSPTSLLFGVWDSRATQVKLPRILKAQIRATDVEQLTRSAQYSAAVDFVQDEVIDESFDKGADEKKNPLSEWGMKDVPAPRGLGGVIVRGDIMRTVRINLVALRQLSVTSDSGDIDQKQTNALRSYLLSLALVCFSAKPSMNLREGCLLRVPDPKLNKVQRIPFEGESPDSKNNLALDYQAIQDCALELTEAFFGTDDFKDKAKKIDKLDTKFEAGVAEEFLGLSKDDRKKLARGGAITQERIASFKANQAADPFDGVSKKLKELKKNLPKASRGKKAAAVSPGFFTELVALLDAISADEGRDEAVKNEAKELKALCQSDSDTRDAFSKVEDRLKKFKNNQEAGNAETQGGNTPSEGKQDG